MNVCCREVVEPSIKLAKMVNLLKILGFLHFALILGDLFLFGTGIFFFLLVQFLLLVIGITTKHFGQYLLFILICLFDTYNCIQYIGARFQIGFYKRDKTAPFGFLVFLLIFEIFCIYSTFQTYKQSKHEYRLKLGFPPEEGFQMNDNDNDNINGNNNVNAFGLNINDDNDDDENDGNNNDNNNNGNNNNNNNNQGGFRPFQGHGVVVGGGDNNQ